MTIRADICVVPSLQTVTDFLRVPALKENPVKLDSVAHTWKYILSFIVAASIGRDEMQ